MNKTDIVVISSTCRKNVFASKVTNADMVSTLVDDASVLSTVQNWADGYMREEESQEDAPKSVSPANDNTEENTDFICHRQVAMYLIVNTTSTSLEEVGNFLHDEFLKVSALWVPLLLTPNQKHSTLTTLFQNLT